MFTLTAIQKLLKRGIQVELLCYPESRIHIEANGIGILIHTAKAYSYFHPFESIRIANLIRKHDYDLIHTQASKDLWVLVPALNLSFSKIPLILTKQVGSFIVKKDFLHRKIYNRVNIALAISSVIKKNLIDTTPLDESRIKMMHNGVDTSVFDPQKANPFKVRAEFNISEDEIVIGMLARFSWGKGHEEFLFAAKELLPKYPKLRFMIVGEPSRGEDEYAVKIRSLTSEYKLNDKVIFTGYRKDTPDILSAMDIFAFPSHSEAFGIALAEAMAMGKPSVCSNSDGILDIAVDGVTSYLFEKQNGKDLADKLELLINSPVKRKEFGVEARIRIIENFDIEILTDKVISIYQEVTQIYN